MSINGKWNITVSTPMGEQSGVLSLTQEGDTLTGEMSGSTLSAPIENGAVNGDTLTWDCNITTPMPMTLNFSGSITDGNIAGNVKLGAFGESAFSGTPV